MDASTNQMVDQQMPFYDLPSKILCRVVNVDLKAEPDTDEIFAQITLFPESNQDEKNAEKEPLWLLPPRPHVHSFCKTLTASDTSTHGGFSVLRRHADDCLPPLDMSGQPPSQELVASDLHGIEWRFRHIFRVVIPKSSGPKDNILYEVKLDFYDKVNVEAGKLNTGVRSIFCVIEKAEKGWWKKLLRRDGNLPHCIKVDWDKWAEKKKMMAYYLNSAKELMQINGTTKSLVANHLSSVYLWGSNNQSIPGRRSFLCKESRAY